jgi:hypothetical protein
VNPQTTVHDNSKSIGWIENNDREKDLRATNHIRYRRLKLNKIKPAKLARNIIL